MKDIVIRPARTDEADILSELAFRSKAYWGYSDKFMQACKEELTYHRNAFSTELFHFVVAELDSIVIGFYAIEQLTTAKAELEALFVEPKWIGRGVGRILMAHAKATAMQLGVDELIVQSDPNAEDFYLAAGGEIIDKRESGSVPGRYLPVLSIAITRADVCLV